MLGTLFKGVSTLVGETILLSVGIGTIYVIGYYQGRKKSENEIEALKRQLNGAEDIKFDTEPDEATEATE